MAFPSCMSSDIGTVLHPFFAKSSNEYRTAASTNVPTQLSELECRTTSNFTEQMSDQSLGSVDATNTKSSTDISPTLGHAKPGKNQTTLSKAFKLEQPSILLRENDGDLPSSYDGANEQEDGSRKRRKTSLNTLVDVRSRHHDTSLCSNRSRRGQPDIESRSAPMEQSADEICKTSHAPNDISTRHDKTPPKKLLRLSGSGKFSSPPMRIVKDETKSDAQQVFKKKGRPKKSKDVEAVKQRIVVIRYQAIPPKDDWTTLGEKIDDILAGRTSIQPLRKTPKTKRTPRKPAKATHPFFNDKPKPIKLQKPESPQKTSAITPGKLRAQARPETLHGHDNHVYESALLKDRHMMKHPGAKDPLWPAQDTVHVRDIDPCTLPHEGLVVNRRKLKSILRPIALEHSLLTKYTRQLEPEQDTQIRADGFHEPNPDLYIPDRLLISGADIVNDVLKQVKAPLRYGEADELSNEPHSWTIIHPALTHIISSIPSYLSGFDELKGETTGWTIKHAPTCAANVLQPVNETSVLKSWLQSLTVNSVGGVQSEHHVEQGKQPKRKKKRRKVRHDELDDFIVDEDDDNRSMVTVSDNESSGGLLKSMVQTQVKGIRASNVILISGPHGCGKTAAVYAVAKELNYRVFEISSAERRSGKDVLDKIGNVTENHMVKHHAIDTEPADKTKIEESEQIEAAFTKDLESGRQGKMSAFFKPNAAKKTSVKSTKRTESAAAKSNLLNSLQKTVKRSTKEQQQSLILLEEVDILFKDDKDFWSTVLRLMVSSKRPFILTCNDEDLVPVQTLSLHAVLRFAPPTHELAVDYLLLVAAKEGHLLQRSVVTDLWHYSGQDLRRSLSALDFWCRMGVGDIRDGLTWLFQRWPAGSDLDAKGRQLRVVSRGTFHADILGTADESFTKEIQHSQRDLGGTSLRNIEAIARVLSDIDVFSQHCDIDPSLPDTSAKGRQQYIDGMQLLDVKQGTDYWHLATSIESYATAIAISQLAQTTDPPTSNYDQLSRKAFAAFDGLANPVYLSSTPTGMETSVFDGPLAPIVMDVAPYVRQILRHDLMLEEQRTAMAGPGKQLRKTRAAMSALEGGQRQLVRRQWWWEGVGDLRPALVTAGASWAYVERAAMNEARIGTTSDAIMTAA